MSKFLDILERFKNGAATDEEVAIVNEEIEKHAAIEEYLAEEFENTMPDTPDNDDDGAGKRIARKVRFRIVGSVLIALLVIGALAAMVVYACNSFYYDPNKGIEEIYGGDGQLLIDMWVFNELHSPEYTTMNAEAWRDSPGCYQLRISQTNLFTGREEILTERIVRGEAVMANDRAISGYWRFPIGNAFGYREGGVVYIDENGTEHRNSTEEMLQELIDEIKLLPASSRVEVYITFEHDLTLDEFAQFKNKWSDDLWFLYAAVLSREGYIPNTLGFSPDGGGIMLETLPSEYPYMQLFNHYDELQTDPAYVWEQHFRSLLNHLIDRPQFLEALANINGISPHYYKEVLEYIDQNGMLVYGALISGTGEDVLSFLENEDLADFYVSDVRLSALSRG